MLAGQDPTSIDAVIAEKNRHLDEDPDMTRLYLLLSTALYGRQTIPESSNSPTSSSPLAPRYRDR